MNNWNEARAALIARRDKLGWTNYRLAQESGVPEPTIHRVMNGERTPSADLLIRIAKSMGLNLKLSAR